MSSQPQNAPLPKPERGGCLSIWLAVSALFIIIAFFGLAGLASEAERQGIGAVIYVLMGMSVLSLVCLYGIYEWKRWGVYGLAAISIISPFVEASLGVADASDCIAPFVQLGILAYLVNDKWMHFD